MGGADRTKPGAPRLSDALTPEQQHILATRGVLAPDERDLRAEQRRLVELEAALEEAAPRRLQQHRVGRDHDAAPRIAQADAGRGEVEDEGAGQPLDLERALVLVGEGALDPAAQLVAPHLGPREAEKQQHEREREQRQRL